MVDVTLDTRALRVLAHPLRVRLLSELRLHGAANATQLAMRLGTNTGATSYHLRRLAEVELVDEAPGRLGRERFWVARHDSHQWRTTRYENEPDATAAANWLRRNQWLRCIEHAEEWERARHRWPDAWQEAASLSDAIVAVNPDQLSDLMEELHAVVVRYRDVPHGADSRTVVVTLSATPVDRATPP
jgi:DNA-binding transcriptional ArsR family regulator